MNKSETIRQLLRHEARAMSLDEVVTSTGFSNRNSLCALLWELTKRGEIERIESDDKVPRWQLSATQPTAPRPARTKKPPKTRAPKLKRPTPPPIESTGLAVSVDLHTNVCCIAHGEGSIVLDNAALAELLAHLPRAQAALEA